jgi:hypothetical protein
MALHLILKWHRFYQNPLREGKWVNEGTMGRGKHYPETRNLFANTLEFLPL